MIDRLRRRPDHPFLDGWVGGSEQVRPNLFHIGTGDASTFIRHFDDHVLVLIPVGNDHLDGRVIGIDPVPFHSSPHAVLQQLQQNVIWNLRNEKQIRCGGR